MKWELQVEAGQHVSKRIPLTTRFLIGRDDVCDLRAVSAAVSRRHCLLSPDVAHLFVTDCHATNGTFVNDCRICPELPVELHPGDHLRVRPLRFVVSGVDPLPDASDELSVAEMLLEMDRQEQGDEEVVAAGSTQASEAISDVILTGVSRSTGEEGRSSSSLAAENLLRTCLGATATSSAQR